MSIKLKLIDGGKSPGGAQVGVGVITVEQLSKIFTVDVFAQSRGRAGKGGYQRKPKPYRISSIAQKISEKDYYIPVSLIFNNRTPDIKAPKFVDGVANAVISNKLYCLDGQNRSLSFLEVYNNPEKYGVDKEEFGSRKMNVVIFWGAELEEEVEQFFDINHFAQAVPPGNRIELEAFLGRGDEITNTLVDLVWELQDSKYWEGVITYPNSEDGIIPNSGWVNSLRPVLKDRTMARIQDLDKIKKLLEAVWGGLEMVFPEIFVEKEKYALQRAIGVNTIHYQIPGIINDIKDRNAENFDREENINIYDKSTWYEYLKGLKTFKDTNRVFSDNDTNTDSAVGETVEGHEVWLRGAKGAVGKYSSGAGRRLLNEAITRHLGLPYND